MFNIKIHKKNSIQGHTFKHSKDVAQHNFFSYPRNESAATIYLIKPKRTIFLSFDYLNSFVLEWLQKIPDKLEAFRVILEILILLKTRSNTHNRQV